MESLTGLVYWGIVCPLYGISLFLPSIINDLGYESSKAQLLTVSDCGLKSWDIDD